MMTFIDKGNYGVMHLSGDHVSAFKAGFSFFPKTVGANIIIMGDLNKFNSLKLTCGIGKNEFEGKFTICIEEDK